MGCSNSISHTIDNAEQPIKNCSMTIIRHQSKVIQIIQSTPININPKYIKGDQKNKNQLILKKQQKIKQLKNSKEFIELSIQTSYCVNKLLNTLAQNQILQDTQLKNLLSKNNQALAKKQNRYKNLQARQEKMELQLKKQIQKNYNNRKTVPPKINQQKSDRKNKHIADQDLALKQKQTDDSLTENKENQQYKSVYIDSDYKNKFIKKIDMFRSEVNTFVSKENLQF